MGQSLLRAQETTQFRLNRSFSIKSASAVSTPGKATASPAGSDAMRAAVARAAR